MSLGKKRDWKPEANGFRSHAMGALGVLGVVLAKSKAVIGGAGVIIVKFKFAITVLSMAVSMVAYAWVLHVG